MVLLLSLPAPMLDGPISHAQLITLSRKLSSHNRQTEDEQRNDKHAIDNEGEIVPSSLNSLLRGTKVYVPPPPPKPEPSAEYLALRSKLQAEAETRKYNALLHTPSPAASKRQASAIFSPDMASHKSGAYFISGSDANSDDDTAAADDPLTPSLALNILVSILFTGFATYWALSNFRIPAFFTFSASRTDGHPGALSSQPFRVFVSLFAAIGVGVAEAVVYAAYWRKVVAAKEKERNVPEKKVVVGEFGGGSDGATARKVSESVEIWGKGPNGGARRRVKERWKDNQEGE